MLGRLLILFIIVPFVELYLLIKLGQVIDVWPTLGIIILTGVIGANLAKHQGRTVLMNLNQQLAAGQLPAEPVVDGVLILIAGVLLITPGLITDATGLLLLLPPVRALFRRKLQEALKARISAHIPGMMGGGIPFGFKGGFGANPHAKPSDGDIIDIEPDATPKNPHISVKSLPR